MSNAGGGLRHPGETPSRSSKEPENDYWHHLRAGQRTRRRRGPRPAAGDPGEHRRRATALAVIEAYGAIVRAAGVPLRAAAFGAHAAVQVNAGWLAFGVALGTFWGTALAVAFTRRAARPTRPRRAVGSTRGRP
jgi:hypothetical protein